MVTLRIVGWEDILNGIISGVHMKAFAQISGNENPFQLDDEYNCGTLFWIAHRT